VLVYPIDPKTQKALEPKRKDRFVAGKELFAIWALADQDVFIEVVYTGSTGKKGLLGSKVYKVKSGVPIVFAGKERKGFTIKDDFDDEKQEESFTLYAYPAAALARSDYPAGRVLRGKVVPDRFLHPIYNLAATGKRIDPSKMFETTVKITFTKP
jgi:hypothetical protein